MIKLDFSNIWDKTFDDYKMYKIDFFDIKSGLLKLFNCHPKTGVIDKKKNVYCGINLLDLLLLNISIFNLNINRHKSIFYLSTYNLDLTIFNFKFILSICLKDKEFDGFKFNDVECTSHDALEEILEKDNPIVVKRNTERLEEENRLVIREIYEKISFKIKNSPVFVNSKGEGITSITPDKLKEYIDKLCDNQNKEAKAEHLKISDEKRSEIIKEMTYKLIEKFKQK